MRNTTPIFIVSSGRSGTQMLEKVFNSFQQVEMNHEYMVHYLQPLAVKYYLGLSNFEDTCTILKKLHGSAVHYCSQLFWGDSSNKLSWIIDCLYEIFPTAKFVHLVRDGRKVVSSFYNKLYKECYDDISTSILQNWVDNPKNNIEPPPEKKYWWNVAYSNTSDSITFRRFDQFQRICFHWGDVHRTIIDKLALVPDDNHITFRLEDIILDENKLIDLIKFIDLPYDSNLFGMMQRPHNVYKPKDYLLNKKQQKQLFAIAGDVMSHFKYNCDNEYKMQYHSRKPIDYT
jgi:hypothetical protein